MVSELQQLSVLFVESDLRLYLFLLCGGELCGVELVAEHAAAGDVEADVQRVCVARLVVGAGGNVRPHHRLRIAVGGAALDRHAFARVGVVARPILREKAEIAEVEPSAAARATLEKHEGEFSRSWKRRGNSRAYSGGNILRRRCPCRSNR